jgi:twitching motility protein PilT
VARIDEYLTEVLNRKGSDLHFLAGDPARVRLYGDLLALRPDRLAPDFVREALYEIMPKQAVDRFEAKDGTDFAYHLQGVARFRVNVMRQLSGMGAVLTPAEWERGSSGFIAHLKTEPLVDLDLLT